MIITPSNLIVEVQLIMKRHQLEREWRNNRKMQNYSGQTFQQILKMNLCDPKENTASSSDAQ